MPSLIKGRPVARWATAAAAVGGLGIVGYYVGVHVPRLRQQCRPLPPSRQTLLFVAGSETLKSFLPQSMPRWRFYALVVYRLLLLSVHLLQMLGELLVTVLRGQAVFVRQAEVDADGKSSGVVRWTLPPDCCIYNSLLRLLKSMGPAYIKMGQWAATRPDIFPESLITKLSELFDSAPAHPWEYTQRELQRHGLLEHLENIEEKPLNSGSVGQVHRATLKTSQHVEPPRIEKQESGEVPISMYWDRPMRAIDRFLRRIGLDPTRGVPTDVADLPRGTPVVVKILHPNLREIILADIAVVRFLAWAVSQLPGVEYLSLRQSAKEVGVMLLSQLDLRRECDNLLVFRHNFIGSPNVKFPVPVPQLSSGNILVESFETGLPILQIDVSHPKWAEIAFHSFLKMMLEDNFVHSDLHPGNVLVRHRRSDGTYVFPRVKNQQLPQHHNLAKRDAQTVQPCDDSTYWKLLGTAVKTTIRSAIPDVIAAQFAPSETKEFVILDPGLVTSLSAKERTNFVILFTAIATGDGRIAAKLLLDHAPNQCKDIPAFTREMVELFDAILPKKHGLPTFCFANVQFGFVCSKTFEAMRKHRVRVEGNFATLLASIVVGEGFGRLCDPRFNMLAASVPYLLAYLQQHELEALVDCLATMYTKKFWHWWSPKKKEVGPCSPHVPDFAPAQ